MRKTYFAVREMEKEEKRACMHAHICRHICVYTGMYTNLPMFLTHTEKHNFLYHVCIHEWNEYTQGGKEFGLRSFLKKGFKGAGECEHMCAHVCTHV